MAGIFDKFKDGVNSKLDWKKVKVIGGDIAAGEWDFNGGMMTPDLKTGMSDCVSLAGEIKQVSVQTEESVKDIGKTLGLTIAGGVLAGPLGAIAGYFAGGNRQQTCVMIELKDGRKFLAVVDQRIYQQILGLSMM